MENRNPNEGNLGKRILSCFQRSPIYSVDEDRVVIEIPNGVKVKPCLVNVYYSKLNLSECDLNDVEQEEITDSDGNFLFTGFGLNFYPWQESIAGYIHVHPNYRLKGIGRNLVTLMEDIARTIGFSKAKIEDPTKPFLSRFGYKSKGKYMEKSL